MTTIAGARLICMPSILLLAAFAVPAHAATLKPLSTLHASTVKLSDLFADAGRNADRVLGPGPAPGARIVVESRQLAAIARSYSVDWRPSSPADRVVLQRAGRPLARAEVMAALKPALVSAGASPDGEIDIGAYDPPTVPAEGTVRPVVTQLDYDATTGRFGAQLALEAGDGDVLAWRVAGRVQDMVEVAVAATHLLPGTILSAADVRLARLPADRVPSSVVGAIADAVGKELRVQLPSGTPLPQSDLKAPTLVRRDAQVLMLGDRPGLSLTAEGKALDSGSLGEHVKVVNPLSRAVVDAVVIAEGRVRVDPDAPPLSPAIGGRR